MEWKKKSKAKYDERRRRSKIPLTYLISILFGPDIYKKKKNDQKVIQSKEKQQQQQLTYTSDKIRKKTKQRNK